MNDKLGSNLSRYIRTASIALLNVVLLVLFASYFSNQRLELINVVGIFADSIGITTGLLGIWFYFLSEELNRSASLNLQKTADTVSDLRNQMWDMIEKSFYSKDDTRGEIEKIKELIQDTLDTEDPNVSMPKGDLELLLGRIGTVEESVETIRSFSTPSSSPTTSSSKPLDYGPKDALAKKNRRPLCAYPNRQIFTRSVITHFRYQRIRKPLPYSDGIW